jgi:uncharacterized protein (TIGR02996 family)
VRELSAAAGDPLDVLPGEYVELMTTWGPGRLCDVLELPDPTAPAGRFRHLQQRLRVEGAARHLAGAWAALSAAELRRGVVLGTDRRGLAVLARSPSSLVLLHPSGRLVELGSFEAFVRRFLRGGQLALTHASCFESAARNWAWSTVYDDLPQRNDLGVPATYVTDAPPPRAELLDAWAAGDEAEADAALARVLEAEVAGYALTELLYFLASPGAAYVPAEIRATYADQLYRAARRRLPDLVLELPIREIRVALGKGELAPALLARVAAIVERPDGIFVGEPDAAERALLESLAGEPSDAAARSVYADHLEERGALARAEALRAETAHVAPLPDAAARGFVAPPELDPVDGAARLRERVARWRAEDPAFSTGAALARIDALHPAARQGYEVLLELASGGGGWGLGRRAVEARGHLAREIADAWPQLALALRGHRAPAALGVLRDARVRDAAPFLLSLLRRPSAACSESWQLQLADAYLELGRVTKALREELIPYLAADAQLQPIHQPRRPGLGVPLLRAIAFRVLVDAGADDRVFEGALRFFCDAHPYSERILRKRKTDPRVRQVLGEQLAAEDKKSLRDGGRRLVYTPKLGLLARYLAKLGDPEAQALFDRYKKFKRFSDNQGRERYE